jgi:hypothetical protein
MRNVLKPDKKVMRMFVCPRTMFVDSIVLVVQVCVGSQHADKANYLCLMQLATGRKNATAQNR